ncbi:MAG: response regulator transcription factor [Niabella sp.]
MDKKINLLIVDDHELVRDGLKQMLGNQNLNISEAASIQEAKNQIVASKPDIILLDFKLKDGTGDILARWLSHSRFSIPCITLSNYSEKTYISKMISAGVKGYLLKDIDRNELMKAIRTVLSGQNYFPQSILETVSIRLPIYVVKQKNITKREQEILIFLMDQLTSEQISELLFISKRTVEKHRLNLLKKFNVKNTLSLIKELFLS